MQKEDMKYNNDFGIASVIIGILSVLFSILIGIGIILGILGLIFGFVQRKKEKNKWSLWGIILSIIGIILGILIIWALVSYISSSVELYAACQANPSLPQCEPLRQLIELQQSQQYGQ